MLKIQIAFLLLTLCSCNDSFQVLYYRMPKDSVLSVLSPYVMSEIQSYRSNEVYEVTLDSVLLGGLYGRYEITFVADSLEQFYWHYEIPYSDTSYKIIAQKIIALLGSTYRKEYGQSYGHQRETFFWDIVRPSITQYRMSLLSDSTLEFSLISLLYKPPSKPIR